MPLEDRDIFNAICVRYADQPIEFIMEQYEKAKLLNMGIEQRAGAGRTAPVAEAETEQEEVEIDVDEAPAPVKKKRYQRRFLKVKPEEAITKEAIYCCICGKPFKSITSRHLNIHDINVADYKKLCGYPADQNLMSEDQLARSREVIRVAKKSRL
ncbi:MAG: MucR family transcriptional regulator, partial [Desulfovibrio sp.]|nr:MucR family transcriptional regulator [Desulfovibrio sp.]